MCRKSYKLKWFGYWKRLMADKQAVITVLKHLQQTLLFVLQDESQFGRALATFENHAADFSDCLILSGCMESNHELFTFDKKFARLQSVMLLDEKQR